MDIGTALQCAIASNHIDLIETLIRTGFDVNARHLNPVRDEGVPAKVFPLTAVLPKKLHMEVLFRYGARLQGEAIAKASRRGSLDVLPMLIKRAKQNDMEGLDRGTLVSAHVGNRTRSLACEKLLASNMARPTRQCKLGCRVTSCGRNV